VTQIPTTCAHYVGINGWSFVSSFMLVLMAYLFFLSPPTIGYLSSTWIVTCYYDAGDSPIEKSLD